MPIRSNHFYLYTLALLVGGVSGLVASAFHRTLDFVAYCRLSLHSKLMDSDTLSISFPSTDHPIHIWLFYALVGGLLVCLSLWLMRKFAPETHGSGIPQVEGLLVGKGTMRWWLVLPVKFVASVCAIAPGLLLGREGPTIQMGAACGQMIAGSTHRARPYSKTLMAAGVAAGLAAAFNAPIAGIMLVAEEMRDEFDVTPTALICIALASGSAVTVSYLWLGYGLDLDLQPIESPPLAELPLFMLLGLVAGVWAVGYNRCLLLMVSISDGLGKRSLYLLVTGVGMLVGTLLWYIPNTVGGGEHLIKELIGHNSTLTTLLVLLIVRTLLSVVCYSTGVPGGIFAPLLALGALVGLAFNNAIENFLPQLVSTPTIFAIAAMGAIFSGSVRAPLTGIILIIEITGAFGSSLPIIIACMMAAITAEGLSGEPIYNELKQLKQNRGVSEC